MQYKTRAMYAGASAWLQQLLDNSKSKKGSFDNKQLNIFSNDTDIRKCPSFCTTIMTQMTTGL